MKGKLTFIENYILGRPLGPVGLMRGNVAGSFMHLIDAA